MSKIRFRWMKIMYLYTILGVGGFGLGLLLIPEALKAIFGWPDQDPLLFGITGSGFAAFSLLSILGFRSPHKFVSVLFLQLCYKTIWFIAVLLPLFLAGRIHTYGWILAGIYE